MSPSSASGDGCGTGTFAAHGRWWFSWCCCCFNDDVVAAATDVAVAFTDCINWWKMFVWCSKNILNWLVSMSMRIYQFVFSPKTKWPLSRRRPIHFRDRFSAMYTNDAGNKLRETRADFWHHVLWLNKHGFNYLTNFYLSNSRSKLCSTAKLSVTLLCTDSPSMGA